MQNFLGGLGGEGVGVKVNKVQGVLWECESSEYQFLNKFLASKASFFIMKESLSVSSRTCIFQSLFWFFTSRMNYCNDVI